MTYKNEERKVRCNDMASWQGNLSKGTRNLHRYQKAESAVIEDELTRWKKYTAEWIKRCLRAETELARLEKR
jgi:hypothetical protein